MEVSTAEAYKRACRHLMDLYMPSPDHTTVFRRNRTAIYTKVLLFREAKVSDAASRHQESVDAVGVIPSEVDFPEEPFCPGIIIPSDHC